MQSMVHIRGRRKDSEERQHWWNFISPIPKLREETFLSKRYWQNIAI